ncbi:MAG: type II CRISPR-associated endonuclease Cas1 [Planctomycetes bacterium]|nr:type II CRISPR-associated endonuclease Cas1 [Planctomycetota bacterium]
MIKRTVEISGHETSLYVKNGQIEVSRNGEMLGSVPAEDIGLLIVDTPYASYSHGTLLALLEHGACVVVCGKDHLPTGLLWPMAANSLQTRRIRAQAGAKRPRLKRLWKQIVRAKIRRQARLLQDLGMLESLALQALAQTVRSGDPTNVEAQAARKYWAALFGQGFKRERAGQPPNGLLNYGYMVLRAAMARALCGAGLHPSLGIHHSNQYNAFALADDLFEPLRPIVDRAVHGLFARGLNEVDKQTKAVLLGLLTEESALTGMGRGPLLVAIDRYASSLAECFDGERTKLDIPKPWT